MARTRWGFVFWQSYPPVLHRCGSQQNKLPLDDVIGLRQPLLPVLQGQLGSDQVTARLLVLGVGQPAVGHAQRPQPLLHRGRQRTRQFFYQVACEFLERNKDFFFKSRPNALALRGADEPTSASASDARFCPAAWCRANSGPLWPIKLKQ